MAEAADDRSGDLVARWRAGDQSAAAELFGRYASRLVALARSRLPRKLAHRVEPEDVVQSVYRSFFEGARKGRYELERGGDLWRLLMTITLHKLYHQVRRNSRGKRAVEQEQGFGSEDSLAGLHAHMLTHEPSPAEAAALAMWQAAVDALVGRAKLCIGTTAHEGLELAARVVAALPLPSGRELPETDVEFVRRWEHDNGLCDPKNCPLCIAVSAAPSTASRGRESMPNEPTPQPLPATDEAERIAAEHRRAFDCDGGFLEDSIRAYGQRCAAAAARVTREADVAELRSRAVYLGQCNDDSGAQIYRNAAERIDALPLPSGRAEPQPERAWDDWTPAEILKHAASELDARRANSFVEIEWPVLKGLHDLASGPADCKKDTEITFLSTQSAAGCTPAVPPESSATSSIFPIDDSGPADDGTAGLVEALERIASNEPYLRQDHAAVEITDEELNFANRAMFQQLIARAALVRYKGKTGGE